MLFKPKNYLEYNFLARKLYLNNFYYIFSPLKSIVILDYAFSLRNRLAYMYTQDPLLSESSFPRLIGKTRRCFVDISQAKRTCIGLLRARLNLNASLEHLKP